MVFGNSRKKSYIALKVICGSHENVPCRSPTTESLSKSPSYCHLRPMAVFLPRCHFPWLLLLANANVAELVRQTYSWKTWDLRELWSCPKFLKLCFSVGQFYQPPSALFLLQTGLDLLHTYSHSLSWLLPYFLQQVFL